MPPVRISNTEVVENLGLVDLFIADKTGTLTMNELILREIFTDGELVKIEYK